MKTNYEKHVHELTESNQSESIVSFDLLRRIEPQVNVLKNALNQNAAFAVTCEWINKFRTVEPIHQPRPAPTPTPLVVGLFDRLRTQLGEQVHCGEWHEVTQEQINLFAQTTGDKQWIHLDQHRARRESPFRSTVAHGYLVLGLLPVLRGLEEDKLFDDIRFVINSGLLNLEFEAPVKPGQFVRALSTLKDMQISRRYVEVTEGITVEIENTRKNAFKADVVFKLYP